MASKLPPGKDGQVLVADSTTPSGWRWTTPEWEDFHADKRGGYLGKLELIARLTAELDGERAVAIREANRHGATIADIMAAGELKRNEVRRALGQ